MADAQGAVQGPWAPLRPRKDRQEQDIDPHLSRVSPQVQPQPIRSRSRIDDEVADAPLLHEDLRGLTAVRVSSIRRTARDGGELCKEGVEHRVVKMHGISCLRGSLEEEPQRLHVMTGVAEHEDQRKPRERLTHGGQCAQWEDLDRGSLALRDQPSTGHQVSSHLEVGDPRCRCEEGYRAIRGTQTSLGVERNAAAGRREAGCHPQWTGGGDFGAIRSVQPCRHLCHGAGPRAQIDGGGREGERFRSDGRVIVEATNRACNRFHALGIEPAAFGNELPERRGIGGEDRLARGVALDDRETEAFIERREHRAEAAREEVPQAIVLDESGEDDIRAGSQPQARRELQELIPTRGAHLADDHERCLEPTVALDQTKCLDQPGKVLSKVVAADVEPIGIRQHERLACGVFDANGRAIHRSVGLRSRRPEPVLEAAVNRHDAARLRIRDGNHIAPHGLTDREQTVEARKNRHHPQVGIPGLRIGEVRLGEDPGNQVVDDGCEMRANLAELFREQPPRRLAVVERTRLKEVRRLQTLGRTGAGNGPSSFHDPRPAGELLDSGWWRGLGIDQAGDLEIGTLPRQCQHEPLGVPGDSSTSMRLCDPEVHDKGRVRHLVAPAPDSVDIRKDVEALDGPPLRLDLQRELRQAVLRGGVENVKVRPVALDGLERRPLLPSRTAGHGDACCGKDPTDASGDPLEGVAHPAIVDRVGLAPPAGMAYLYSAT